MSPLGFSGGEVFESSCRLIHLGQSLGIGGGLRLAAYAKGFAESGYAAT